MDTFGQRAKKKARRRVDTSESWTRFALDELLRSRGFRILSRRKGWEAVWERDRNRYPQHLALQEIPVAEVIRARALERNYLMSKYQHA